MPYSKFAWLVHCNNEASADSALHDASVNWVMPWGGEAGKTWPADGPTGAGVAKQVWARAGDLLRPWRYDITEWHGIRGDAMLEPLTAMHASTATDQLGLWRSMERELESTTIECERPFSHNSEHLPTIPDSDPDQRAIVATNTLPHAFAPLTHLPAAVSQDMLGVSRYFRYPAALGEFIAYAPAFSVTLDGAMLTFTPASSAIADRIVSITYRVSDAGGVDVPDHDFQLITQAALSAPPRTGLATVSLAAADTADIPSREVLLAGALNPFTLLVGCLVDILAAAAKLPANTVLTARPAKALLADLLGRGLLRVDSVPQPGAKPMDRYVGVWERVGANPPSGQAMYAAFAQAPARIALLAELEQCRTESAAALPELWTIMAPLLAFTAPGEESKPWPLDSYGGQRGRALLPAAAWLLGSASARQLRAMWFAAMARRYAKDHPGDAFFDASLTFEHWYRRLLPLLDDYFCTLLLAGETRNVDAEAWLTDASRIDDASAARLVAGLAQQAFANAGHTAAEQAILDLLMAAAGSRVEHLRIALNGHDHLTDIPVSLGEDRDLAISVAFTDAKVSLNQEIRGYAVAIAAGPAAPEEKLSWQWVTDVAAHVWQNGSWKKLSGPGDKLLRMHDTIGATRFNGRDVVTFSYSGTALNGRLSSIEGSGDPDGLACLDFFWPASWPTPRLAYGLHYWALATPIGNAGRILDDDFADPADDHRRRLKELDAAMFNGTKSRYLCRVAPGSPLISLTGQDQAYELADESRTHVHLRQNASTPEVDGPQRIALIRNENALWKRGSEEISFTIRGPAGTPNVIERWIEADIAAATLGHGARDSAAAGLDATGLAAQQSKYRKLLKPATKASVSRPKLSDAVSDAAHAALWPRHPAVRAFLVEVAFYDEHGSMVKSDSAIFFPGYALTSGYVGEAKITVVHGSQSQLGASGTKVTLKPGHFVALSVSSLVPETFFDAATEFCRMTSFPGLGNIVDPNTHEAYRRFAPAVHWVECLPEPSTDGAIFEKLARRLLVEPDGRKVVARIGAERKDALDATWLKGFLVQRHEWHWSGYPISFPRTASGAAALKDWAEPFIGTESLRESTVWTIHTSLSDTGWNFAGEAPENLAAAELPGEHGAKYVAYVVRMVRRFDSWLKRWPDLDNTVLAAGLLAPAKVRWDDPGLRLAPPDVKTAVPLVKTFEPRGTGDEVRISSGANGCLLCLNDVLYRTDALARFGGVGESIEVDLEETRINGIYEIGPNPVFHAAPGQPPVPASGGALDMPRLPYPSLFAESGAISAGEPYRKMNWRLEADRAFGLTNDLDRNAKVAQTAIIIRPRGNDVDKYWVMAKVRLRRMLDPTEAWTAPAKVARDAKLPNTWTLTRRAEGDDWVPHDFCVDAGASAVLVRLGLAGAAKPAPIDILAPAPATRYLCTWHKGYWANDDRNLWGLQVFSQQLAADQRQWQTVARNTPYETWSGLADLNIKDQSPLALQLECAAVAGASGAPSLSLRRLLVSNYSAPHWLTFIGLPYRDVSFADESYWVVPDGKGLALKRTNRARGHDGAIENGEPVSRDLLLLPVEAKDFADTGSVGSVAQERNSFHLLLMFKRINDVSAPAVGLPLGELLGAYKPVRAAVSAGDPYPPLRFVSFMAGGLPIALAQPDDCVGYIYRFHTPHSEDMKPIDSWEQLQTLMFPPKDPGTGAGPEAKVRWTPEFIGPVALSEAGRWPQGIARPLAVIGTTIQIESLKPVAPSTHKSVVQIVLDLGIGWRVQERKHAGPLVPDDIVSGNCQIDLAPVGDGGLELQVAGGRLLARLAGWPMSGIPDGVAQVAVLFDREGQRVETSCTWKVVPSKP